MNTFERPVTRRDFLRGTASAGLVTTIGFTPGATKGSGHQKKARVVLVRDPDALDARSRPNARVIQRMLDQAATMLLGENVLLKAWKGLIKPTDLVGEKSNAWNYLPTPPAPAQAIRRRILDAGVPEKNISIDDRGVSRNPIFLQSNVLINVRPLRTHFWSGMGGCMKNYIMFAPHPPDYHHDSCADLAAIWKLPIVKGKTKLNILSVLQGLFHGRGPHHFSPRYRWNYKGLIIGTDPVAVDAIGLRIIQAKRLEYFGSKRRLETVPKHITMADTKHHLGISNLAKIELIKLGWRDRILI